MIDKPLADMTEAELRAERNLWSAKIKGATQWGAAVAAADEFRRDAEREMRRRGMRV